jgi:hypothetical protein
MASLLDQVVVGAEGLADAVATDGRMKAAAAARTVTMARVKCIVAAFRKAPKRFADGLIGSCLRWGRKSR